MFKFSYNEEKNRIYINVEGDLTFSEIDDYIKELIALIEKAKPRFTVLADLSESRISFVKKSAEFQFIRDYSVKKGLENVATVLEAYAYELHKSNPFPGVRNTFLCISEAEAFLDSLL